MLRQTYPAHRPDLQARYESLWTMQEMVEERELVQAKVEDARRIASSLNAQHSLSAHDDRC